MSEPVSFPPLKPLHPEALLNPGKLAKIESLETEVIKQSLVPGQRDCLKTRPDGTILDGITAFMFFVSAVRRLMPCHAK
jgi:hypothetical protein